MAFSRGANVVTDGLVLYLDAANRKSYISGSTSWRDMAGTEYLGTLTNGPTYSSDNYGSIVFDGANDYINSSVYSVSSSLSFYTGSFSLEATVKPTSYQTGSYFGLANMVMMKGNATTFNYAMQVTSDTSVSFIKRNSTDGGLQFRNFTVPSMLNTVNSITFTIDSTGTNVTCYLSGNLIGSATITGTKIGPGASDPIWIGGLSTAGLGTQFIGNIYTVKIYNKTLSTEQVQQNYNALKSRYNL